MSKNILIWGAGKIGRGFVADLFNDAGYELCFVDASQDLIDRMNERKEYKVLRHKSDTDKATSHINKYKALHTSQKHQIWSYLLDCDLMAIALFPEAFNDTADDLKAIIRQRAENNINRPLDIILCANIFSPSNMLKEILLSKLTESEKQYFEKHIGLVDSLVIRMAVQPTDEMIKDDPLVVLTNGYEKITLSKRGFKGEAPAFEGVVLTENIQAEEQRKMYTYNMVHALYAYLGAQKGYVLVEECIADEAIQACAVGALDEAAQALIAEFGFTQEEMSVWNKRVLKNMANPILKDKVERVGGDPIRKLKKQDRLTGPAMMCKDHGILPYYLTKAIAYGFLFVSTQDENAKITSEYAEYYGIKKAAEKYCGLEKEPELLSLIAKHYTEASEKKAEDSKKVEIIKRAYAQGFEKEKVYKGCAQCTLMAFFDLMGKEDERLFKSASGFSGGMALSGDGVCGGYSGGMMAMGSVVGRSLKQMMVDGDKEAQYESYVMAQALRDKFLDAYGSVVCQDIHERIFGKSYCLRIKAVRDEFEKAGAHTNKCTNVVGMASAWMAEILYEHGYLGA